MLGLFTKTNPQPTIITGKNTELMIIKNNSERLLNLVYSPDIVQIADDNGTSFVACFEQNRSINLLEKFEQALIRELKRATEKTATKTDAIYNIIQQLKIFPAINCDEQALTVLSRVQEILCPEVKAISPCDLDQPRFQYVAKHEVANKALTLYSYKNFPIDKQVLVPVTNGYFNNPQNIIITSEEFDVELMVPDTRDAEVTCCYAGQLDVNNQRTQAGNIYFPDGRIISSKNWQLGATSLADFSVAQIFSGNSCIYDPEFNSSLFYGKITFKQEPHHTHIGLIDIFRFILVKDKMHFHISSANGEIDSLTIHDILIDSKHIAAFQENNFAGKALDATTANGIKTQVIFDKDFNVNFSSHFCFAEEDKLQRISGSGGLKITRDNNVVMQGKGRVVTSEFETHAKFDNDVPQLNHDATMFPRSLKNTPRLAGETWKIYQFTPIKGSSSNLNTLQAILTSASGTNQWRVTVVDGRITGVRTMEVDRKKGDKSLSLSTDDKLTLVTYKANFVSQTTQGDFTSFAADGPGEVIILTRNQVNNVRFKFVGHWNKGEATGFLGYARDCIQ